MLLPSMVCLRLFPATQRIFLYIGEITSSKLCAFSRVTPQKNMVFSNDFPNKVCSLEDKAAHEFTDRCT